MGAAAVDAVFVPAPGIHEGLDEEPEGVLLAEFELPEEVAEGGVVAAALCEILQLVADLVAEKPLDRVEIDELGR